MRFDVEDWVTLWARSLRVRVVEVAYDEECHVWRYCVLINGKTPYWARSEELEG